MCLPWPALRPPLLDRQFCASLPRNFSGYHPMTRLLRLCLLLASVTVALPCAAQFRLSEFMASNTRGLRDEDFSYEDWIEIQNASTNAASLAGWYLTDDNGKPRKWMFPATNVPAGGLLVVFASDKDRRVPGRPLHTNFKLTASGEYLALVQPDGSTRATEFAPAYPPQAPDVSFGLSMQTLTVPLVRSNALGSVLAPPDASVDGTWMQPQFNDTAWLAATNGLGFDTGAVDPEESAYEGRILQLQPELYWRLNETTPSPATNLGSLGAAGDGLYQVGALSGVAGPRPPQFDMLAPDNTAVQFDGVSGFVGGPSGLLNGRSAFTLAGWINPTTPPGSRIGLFGQNDVVEFGFEGLTSLIVWTPVNTVAITYPYPTNEWHHVAVVGAPDRLQIYLDGWLWAESVVSVTDYGFSEYDFNAGGGGIWDAEGNSFNGRLDEVSVWGRALTAAEIAALVAPAASSQVDFTPLIVTDLASAMDGQRATAYLRLPFTVSDPSVLSTLRLSVRYDDGFVAWLNGAEIARRNAAEPVAWNSTAIARHADALAVQWEEIEVTPALGFLMAGSNLLAVQGLNVSATNTDFFLQAELSALSVARSDSQYRYFTLPTPGQPNGYGTADLGPIFLAAGHSPNIPAVGQSLVVTARVAQAFLPVTNVTVRYRYNFGGEVAATLNDSGTNGDLVAGDGIYTAAIPGIGAGVMIRYYFQALDAANNRSRWPLYVNTADSEAYLGTVVAPANILSELPLTQLFIANAAAADTTSGTRGSLFYAGELYDNVLVSLHGQSSAGWPKKSHNLDFTSDHRFLHTPGKPRVKDIKLLSNYGDKARMRTTLAYEKIAEGGSAAHFSFQTRVQMNNTFFGIFDYVEDADDLWLERLGRDPNGALYKMYNELSSPSGNEKKSRTWEGTADLNALIANLNEALPLATRATYAYDNLDLPQAVSYFATLALVSHQDHGHKNYYLYRDSDQTGEWAILPWDVDLSFGRNWLDSYGYFSDTLYTNNTLSFYPATGQGKPANRFYNVIFDHPDFRRMYLRRLRTLLDTYLPAPGTTLTAERIETRVRQLEDLMDPPAIATSDADLDKAKWGPTWGDQNVSTLRVDAERIISTYLPGRRNYILNDAAAILRNERVPAPQPTNMLVQFTAADYNPVSGNQDEEYVRLSNTNAFAVDLSGWQLSGGVKFTLRPGTVLPAGGALYLSPNVAAFRNRAVGPRRGQNIFVQGPYSGRLNAWGETLTLTDNKGRAVSTFTFPGAPSDAQRYLRLTELMYNPAAQPGNTNDAQEFEFVELRNTATNVTLNLAGVRFTNGLAFNFTGSAIASLLPGQRVLLVKNLVAFQQRYGSGLPVAGQYTGSLDNGGESLRLEDAVGEKILEFDYNNSWYPITDGLGFSLAIVNDLAPWHTWGMKAGWRPNGQLGGSPGTTNPTLPVLPPILVNEALTHTDPPQVDTIELYNPTGTNVSLAGWFLTDDFYAPKKYRLPTGTVITAGSYVTVADTQFNAAGQGTNRFALSALGDEVYLFSGDAGTNLTGYFHGFDFGAAPNGVPFGRYVNSQTNEQAVLLMAFTPGTTNAPPRVGPLVVSEIMYHPPDLAGGVDDALNEFIELANVAATNTPLFDPAAITNTWRLRNAVDFDFPLSTALAPGARLLVVGFDPATNAAQLSAFRTLYSVPTNVPVLGPWQGKLDNSGETLELKAPDAPNVTATNVSVPYYLVEKIAFRDAAPWPAEADGLGWSLQRFALAAFANDPTNWSAALPSAGRPNTPNLLPIVSLTTPADGFVLQLPGALVLAATADDADGSVVRVEFYDGATLLGQTTAAPYALTLTNPPPGAHTYQARAVDDLGGSRFSALANGIVLSQPPLVAITSPADGALFLTGSTITVNVSASDPDGTVASVDFLTNGVVFSESMVAPYRADLNGLAAGIFKLAAVAQDNSGRRATSAVVTVASAAGSSNSVPLVSSASVWRYFDKGSLPAADWFATNYTDTAWSNAPASLGYGGGESNTVSYGPNSSSKYVTTYFRRAFTATNIAEIATLELGLIRDDGALVFLNGTEVFRIGMPIGAITDSTPANETVAGTIKFNWNLASIPANLLREGTNFLAVEMHQVSGASSDILFDLRLNATRVRTLPLLAEPPQSVVTNVASPATFTVRAWGSGPLNYQWRRNGLPLAGRTTSALALPSVTTNDAGSYTVVVTNAQGSVTSAVATLTVLPYDSDGDGLPDWWEWANGTNPFAPDGNADLDGDGLSNLSEFLAGTSPTNAASGLRLQAVSSLASGTLRMNFDALSNRTYTVQRSAALAAGSWWPLQHLDAAPSNRVYWFTNAPGTSPAFYRVVTPKQP